MHVTPPHSSTRIAGATVALGLALSLAATAPPAFAEPEPAAVDPQETLVESAAEATGIETAELERLLASDSIVIKPGGHLAFVDPAPRTAPATISKGARTAMRTAGAKIPGTPEGGSRPGAPVTVYLDFDGAVVENTVWNLGENASERYELEGAAVAENDPSIRADVWARIAEDYAPFNVNVTTTYPGDDALYKTAVDDETYGSWLVITDSYPDFGAGSGGIAQYQGAGSPFSAPAFVFTTGVGGGDPAGATAKSIAEAGSHEIGHNFGLDHDGFGSEEYFTPDESLWGPIMGAPYESPLTQWSKGDYDQATQHEDDLALITDRAAAQAKFLGWQKADGSYYDGSYCWANGDAMPVPGDSATVDNGDDCQTEGEELTPDFDFVDRADYAADDAGDAPAQARALANPGTFSAKGVIGRTGDVDVYRITTRGGTLTAKVDVAAVGANLDSRLVLMNASGSVLAENAPETVELNAEQATGLGASVSKAVSAGTYYLAVSGVGQGDPFSSEVSLDGAYSYTAYGSLGNYTLSGSAPAALKHFTATPKPKISGTARAGKKLSVKVGAWAPTADRLRIQWLRNGKAITGATKSKYKLTAKDRGKRISVRVTGSKSGYVTVAKTSSAKRVSRG